MTDKKPSGMEMMLMNMLKAAGLDVNEIQANIQGFATGIKNTLAELGTRLNTIDAEQKAAREQLARVEKMLANAGYSAEDGDGADAPHIPLKQVTRQ